MGNQFPKAEVETYWKWARLGFTWYVHDDFRYCNDCKFRCKTLKDAKEHHKIHEGEQDG